MTKINIDDIRNQPKEKVFEDMKDLSSFLKENYIVRDIYYDRSTKLDDIKQRFLLKIKCMSWIDVENYYYQFSGPKYTAILEYKEVLEVFNGSDFFSPWCGSGEHVLTVSMFKFRDKKPEEPKKLDEPELKEKFDKEKFDNLTQKIDNLECSVSKILELLDKSVI